jgi:hypothetical protein
MSGTDPTHVDNIQSLITKLKNIDVSRIGEDEAAKVEALNVAKKVTATLENPINRATDLMFTVRVLHIPCQDKGLRIGSLIAQSPLG